MKSGGHFASGMSGLSEGLVVLLDHANKMTDVGGMLVQLGDTFQPTESRPERRLPVI